MISNSDIKRILVLGCTGSIGSSTLDIARNMQDRFKVVGLSAHTNSEKLRHCAEEFCCPSVLTSREGTGTLKQLIASTTPDIVVNGIAGAAGLEPSRMVLEAGVDLALANKETIVMAAPLVQALAQKNHCRILPVDSEHSALFNLIDRCGTDSIESLIITASGGPFRTVPKEQLSQVTLQDALKHPTWNMGKKITIDSATLANKGLEVIEASYLFHVPADKIQVVVHPQSLIHALVRTKDGVLYAQISEPDMKHPILSALTWPDVSSNYMKEFDLFDQEMTFFRPRINDFPMLAYAFDAARNGNGYPIAYNAANEIAAIAFLEGKTGFTDIPRIVFSVLEHDWSTPPDSFDSVIELDKRARTLAEEKL